MRTAGYVFTGVLAVAGIAAFAVGTSFFGLAVQRPMVKYQVETSRQAWENSISHQEGASQQIADACDNMENASAPLLSRHAFANIIVRDADSYAGSAPLSQNAEDCVSAAHQMLSEPLKATPDVAGASAS